MRKTSTRERGFSLIEMMVVVGIIFAVAALAIIQSFGSIESYRANAAMDVIISQLRVARQLAISQRRTVTISFNTTSKTITYQVVAKSGAASTADANAPAPVTVSIPTQVGFTGFSNEPDTPMAFGTCGGTYGVCVANTSGGPAIMEYTSMGQFTDSTGVNPINGTIFLGVPNQPNTARAVTVLGSTGRVRSYTYIGGTTKWTE